MQRKKERKEERDNTLFRTVDFKNIWSHDYYIFLYCVYTMFPAALAAPFARNVACRGVLLIYFSDFQDLSRFVTFSYVVLRYP